MKGMIQKHLLEQSSITIEEPTFKMLNIKQKQKAWSIC